MCPRNVGSSTASARVARREEHLPAHAPVVLVIEVGADLRNANGGVPACGSPLGSSCSANLGPEAGEGRNDFNDVDDYHGLTQNATMLNSSQTYAEAYPNYQLSVTVAFGQSPNTKLVTINVTTPDNEVITYNLVRSNY